MNVSPSKLLTLGVENHTASLYYLLAGPEKELSAVNRARQRGVIFRVQDGDISLGCKRTFNSTGGKKKRHRAMELLSWIQHLSWLTLGPPGDRTELMNMPDAWHLYVHLGIFPHKGTPSTDRTLE